MWSRVFLIFSALVFSFFVLFVSILRSASVRYSFSEVYANYTEELLREEIEKLDNIKVDYYLAYPGRVRPAHPLWFIKAARDRLWVFVTPNKEKRADLYLLFADKRLVMSVELFEEEKPELGLTTLSKAEKYLDKACSLESEIRQEGTDTLDLTGRLMKASIVHSLAIKKIKMMAPEDAISQITLVENYPRGVYGRKVEVFESRGVAPPKNPLDRI